LPATAKAPAKSAITRIIHSDSDSESASEFKQQKLAIKNHPLSEISNHKNHPLPAKARAPANSATGTSNQNQNSEKSSIASDSKKGRITYLVKKPELIL